LVSNNDEVKLGKKLKSPFASEDTIIHQQYLKLESCGMAYSALLLQRWFEFQYRTRKGIELWENKAGTDDSPPDLGAKTSGGGAQIENKDKVLMENQSVHIGIAHALPLDLDLCVELELPEDELDPEDAKIFDKGIPVQDIRLTRYEGGHEKPRNREPMKHEDGSSIEMISFGVTKLSHLKMVPFNHYRLTTLQLPITTDPETTDPTLRDKNMGGIKREYVEGLAHIIGNLGAENPDTTPFFRPPKIKISTLNYPSSAVISIILGEKIAVQDDSPTEPRATIAGDDAHI
jgi:hypothetical protein